MVVNDLVISKSGKSIKNFETDNQLGSNTLKINEIIV